MAKYQNGNALQHLQDPAFNAVHQPGSTAPFVGVYRCVGCGHEIGIAEEHVLPPQIHLQHPASAGAIRWQLLVFAQHNS